MHETKLIALGLLMSVCGGCIADPQLESSGGDIVNGQLTADYPAVGMLRFAASKNGRSKGWGCTATLIDANVLVTAAHCFGVPEEIGEPDVMAIPTFGLGPTGQSQVSAVRWNDLDPYSDIAVAVLYGSYGGPYLQPGVIGANGNGRPEGRSVLMIGYGETRNDAHDVARRGGWNTIRTVSDSTFTTYALTGRADQADACHGDSGGPVIPYDPSFTGPVVPTFIGVISGPIDQVRGRCGTGTRHTRVDAAWPLIAAGRAAAGNGAVSRKFYTADGQVFTFSAADCDEETCATGDLGGGDERDGDDQGAEDADAGDDDWGGDEGDDGYDDGHDDGYDDEPDDGYDAGGDDVFNPECSCDLSYECEPDDWDPEYDCWCDPDCGW